MDVESIKHAEGKWAHITYEARSPRSALDGICDKNTPLIGQQTKIRPATGQNDTMHGLTLGPAFCA